MKAPKAGWQKLVDEAHRQDLERNAPPSRSATDAEIASLLRRATERRLAIDEGYITFLRYANGIDFNGLTIPRADESPDSHSLDDFVTYNERTSFIDPLPVYGNSDDIVLRALSRRHSGYLAAAIPTTYCRATTRSSTSLPKP